MPPRRPRRPRSPSSITTALALTWLNPHVYLDTLVLLGSIASTHGDERWWFGVGAGCREHRLVPALGFGARLLAPVFARPLAWRILDGLIAVVMFAIAVSLVHRSVHRVAASTDRWIPCPPPRRCRVRAAPASMGA